MKYLLDTDVISQRTKAEPVPAVANWLQTIPSEELGLSAMTIQQVRAGAEALPVGKRRTLIERWLEDDLIFGFRDRILPIDVAVADLCGRLVIRTKMQGKMFDLGDACIAATALVHGLKVATLNRKDFIALGVELVDF